MKAYLDTVQGLIACKVIGWYAQSGRIQVQITAKHSYLEHGAILHYSAHRVIPQDRIVGKRAMRGPRIMPFDWAEYSLDTVEA